MSERERDKEKLRLQHAGVDFECGTFNEQGIRPPVPGEERAHCKGDWIPTAVQQSDWGKFPAGMASSSAQCGPPPTAPRRSSLPHYMYSSTDPYSPHMSHVDIPPDRVLPSEPHSSASPPACLRWARALHHLLQDSDGVELFRKYLQAEGRPHADALDFWFACEGLRKQTEVEKIGQLVKVIYKRFFVKSALPISEELRREVGRQVKEMQPGETQQTVFDLAQSHVERLINNTTYPNFLKSDMYLQYVQAMQNPTSSELSSGSGSSSSSSSVSAREMASLTQGSGLLPTLHEDAELVTSIAMQPLQSAAGSVSGGHHTPQNLEPMRLTKDMLLVTQKRRLDVRPKPEAYCSMNHLSYRMTVPHHPHIVYNSYNPVSRQDSELQSLSSHSDARTESDNMSLTDSSIDGKSIHRSSRKQARQVRAARELAAVNKEPFANQTLIPRTQRIDNKQCRPMKPDQFAAILIQKLEMVKKNQDAQDKLDKKLSENDVEGQSRTLADAIREKFHLEDDNDQDILDQHVSRVWSDQTPSRSPGLLSPRAHSPTRRYAPGVVPYGRSRRKEKDVFSTFSSDSGNVHDFPEPLDHRMTGQGIVKSKSMPEYQDYGQDRFVRQSMSRRSSSKKTLTDLTDSGVSVVSDTPPVPHMPVLPVGKDSRVLTWLMESDRSGRGAMHTHSELSGSKHSRHRPSSATSPNASRHRKTYNQSRSSSLERSSVSSVGVDRCGDRRRGEPAQPFIADPNMPPLPPPHTATQLEEARRRLLEDEIRRGQSRQRGNGKSSSHLADPLSNQSTLRKSIRGVRPPAPLGAPAAPYEEFTTVVFSFCEEQFPYRTKIPGRQITLKQFKDFLPKKGNYRYFFKTECEELDNQVIQEEISCDSDLLPMYEGKVMAQVKPTD